VALGHLHGPQRVSPGVPEGPGLAAGPGPLIRYSGSPLAFSFYERDHRKSVAVVDIGADGQASAELVPAPVPRPLREVRGRLDDLLARADGDRPDPDLAGAWIKAVLTDPVRPLAPMERLRERWPHTLVLDFDPEGGLVTPESDLRALARAADPAEICGLFTEYAGGAPPDGAERLVLRDAVEAALRAEALA
jgi:exonuclease SbcD